jgi:uncharacterized protein (TIGR04222 family)
VLFPFNLTGPQFLAFYAAFAVVVIVVHWVLHIRPGAAAPGTTGPSLDTLTNDPYLIAGLREGADEAIRVAVVNLVDRGLLSTQGSGLRATGRANAESLRRKLDRVIIQRCKFAPLSAAEIVKDEAVRAAAAEIETHLQSQGLLLNAADLAARTRARYGVLLLLAGVSLLRIVQAVMAGRSNLWFLVFETLIACFIAWKLPHARLTQIGQRALSALHTLLERLKKRAEKLAPGGATNEAILVAAMFGLYALPAAAFPFVEETYPRPKSSDSGSSSSDSGSSSDSSGCGGGGGCGGCGGD